MFHFFLHRCEKFKYVWYDYASENPLAHFGLPQKKHQVRCKPQVMVRDKTLRREIQWWRVFLLSSSLSNLLWQEATAQLCRTCNTLNSMMGFLAHLVHINIFDWRHLLIWQFDKKTQPKNSMMCVRIKQQWRSGITNQTISSTPNTSCTYPCISIRLGGIQALLRRRRGDTAWDTDRNTMVNIKFPNTHNFCCFRALAMHREIPSVLYFRRMLLK